MGADRAAARGQRLRGRAGRTRLPLLRHTRGGAALRRRRGVAEARPRGRRLHLERHCRRRRPPLRRPRRGGDRQAGPGPWSSTTSALREFLAPLPLTLMPLEGQPPRGARSPSGSRRSDSLPGCRAAPSPNDWGRTAGAPGAWREGEDGSEGGQHVLPATDLVERLEFPEAVAKRADPPPGALAALLDRIPRPSRARRAGDSQGRALGATRRRRFVASHHDASRAERPII